MKVKPKKCKECGEEFVPRFSSFQKVCDKPECRASEKKKPMKPITDSLAKRRKVYNTLKEVWLQGKICPVTGRPATQVHHIKGRRGDLLCDVKFWLAVTQEGHDWIHSHPQEAREKGWLI